MNLKNLKITSRGLYWSLIITFGILYLCVGFVSTLHSITFFNLANSMGLAILLGLTYEVGQASVLFSILMAKKEEPTNYLAWFLMFLLTALQVTANVYASFKFMVSGGSTDWTYWQKSILFGVQASSPEMYQVIISWISGALLPIVALGMTSLVAQRLKMIGDEDDKTTPDIVDKFLSHEFKTPKTPEEEKQDREEIEQLVKEYAIEDEEIAIPNESLIKASKRYNDVNKFSSFVKPENIKSEMIKPQIEFMLTPEPTEIVTSFQHKPIIARNLSKTPVIITKDLDENIKEIIKDDLDEEVERLTIAAPINVSEPTQKIGLSEKQNEELKTELKTFEKDFILPEKKRGRPKVSAVAPKKEQELLQKEEVKVPEKKHRVSDPLKKKSNKPQIIKHIKQINPTSKGEELIESLKDEVKPVEDSATIVSPVIEETASPEPLKEFNDSIEVVDVKAVEVKKK